MLLNNLLLEELKNSCECPEKFQLLDFLGVGLGTFFITHGVFVLRKHNEETALIEMMLGAIMVFIHSQRFFFAKELGINDGGTVI